MDGHLSNILRLLKNLQKSDSIDAHFQQHFNYTASRTDLRKCMTLKVVRHINLIGEMKTFTKPNYNLFMEKRLTNLKNVCEKCVTVMNKNPEIYGACHNKIIFRQFFLSTQDPVLKVKEIGRTKSFKP